jgi:DNA-binding transcriptional LysR family regulator
VHHARARERERSARPDLLDEDSRTLPQQRWLVEVAGDRPIVLRTNDLESQLAAARAGVGVAALPAYLASRHEELRRAETRARPIARSVWLVVHDDLRSARAVRAVMDFLVEAMAELAG